MENGELSIELDHSKRQIVAFQEAQAKARATEELQKEIIDNFSRGVF
ncbi:MAG TPA: hypothetical protein VK436_07205 [Methanocella sp.]|nr:hypothetical protein [Methanocella sp.]